MDEQEKHFHDMLDGKVVDYPLFKKLCYAGIPMGYRLTAYQILLGVLGLDTARFGTTLEAKEQRYLEQCRCVRDAAHGGQGGEVRSEERRGDGKADDPRATTFPDVKCEISRNLEHQIQIDVLRISSIYKRYNGVDVSPVFYNILKMTAYKRPYIGYAQGMADLVVPFIHLFFVTDDRCRAGPAGECRKVPAPQPVPVSQSVVFFCFSSLLNRVQVDIFDLQERLLGRLERVLEVVDGEILRHLHSIGLELHMVCFRWFSCLFIREFSLGSWYRIFDSMLCGDISEFVVFFGAALLIWFREPILKGDLSSVVLQMQNLQDEDLSVENVETLIGSVSYLRKEYRDKKGTGG